MKGLDKTVPTRFKRLKNQKVCVICIICRFHKTEQCFNYMYAKFQGAGFQNIGDTRHRSLDFVCLVLLGHLLVQVTWWFLGSDGSEIQADFTCHHCDNTKDPKCVQFQITLK